MPEPFQMLKNILNKDTFIDYELSTPGPSTVILVQSIDHTYGHSKLTGGGLSVQYIWEGY